MCSDFCLLGNPCDECGGGDCEVTDCVPVCVCHLTSPPDPMIGSGSVSPSNSQLNFCLSQTLSFSESVVPVARWCVTNPEKTRMNVEGSPVKAVPEVVRNKPTPQGALFKAVPECVRNRAPPAPEHTPPQEMQAWHCPPSAPPPEAKDTRRSDHTFHSFSSMRITTGIRGNALSSEGWKTTLEEVTTPWWRSESWSPT